MSWNVGWSFSPMISGWIQVNYGFKPVFVGVISTYVVAIALYWRFFGSEPEAQDGEHPGDDMPLTSGRV
jgi:hypothetical protein